MAIKNIAFLTFHDGYAKGFKGMEMTSIAAVNRIRVFAIAFCVLLVSCAGLWPVAKPACVQPTSVLDLVKNMRAIQIGRSLYSDAFFSSGSFAACFGAKSWRDIDTERVDSRWIEAGDFEQEFVRAVSEVWSNGRAPFRVFATFKKTRQNEILDDRSIHLNGLHTDYSASFGDVTGALGSAYRRDTFSEELNRTSWEREPWNSSPAPNIKIIRYEVRSDTRLSSLVLFFKSGRLENISLHTSEILGDAVPDRKSQNPSVATP